MEGALYEFVSMRRFAGPSMRDAIPDKTTIINFRRPIETHAPAPRIFERINADLTRKGLLLKRGTIVDPPIVSAPSSMKDAEGERNPEMPQTKNGNKWFSGMKAGVGVDADSGLVHTQQTTSAATEATSAHDE